MKVILRRSSLFLLENEPLEKGFLMETRNKDRTVIDNPTGETVRDGGREESFMKDGVSEIQEGPE